MKMTFSLRKLCFVFKIVNMKLDNYNFVTCLKYTVRPSLSRYTLRNNQRLGTLTKPDCVLRGCPPRLEARGGGGQSPGPKQGLKSPHRRHENEGSKYL